MSRRAWYDQDGTRLLGPADFRPGLRVGTGAGWQGKPLPPVKSGLGEWARAWLLVAVVSAVFLGCLLLWGWS